MADDMISSASGSNGTSTRPYLIRALHDWCTDNGFTPYIAVYVDAGVQVPKVYVKDNEIVLNVGFEATHGMKLGNEYIEFKARFGGSSHDIMVPVDHVIAIYARENGQGMAFPTPAEMRAGDPDGEVDTPPAAEAAADRPGAGSGLRLASADGQISAQQADRQAGETSDAAASDGNRDDGALPQPPEPPSPGGRPSLKRIK